MGSSSTTGYLFRESDNITLDGNNFNKNLPMYLIFELRLFAF